MREGGRDEDEPMRRDRSIFENQFVSMLGRSTMQVIHLLRRLLSSIGIGKETYIWVFIELEKPYDKVPKEVSMEMLGV